MNEAQTLLHHLDTRIESRVQVIRQERDWWPCQRGCAHCCRHLAHPLELSAAEWIRVDEAVAQLSTSEQAIIEQKIDALLQQIADRTLGSAVVCPYLDEAEGACRIYDARPIACRTYGFFVARNHNQYCQLIETETTTREDNAIVWGNAEAIRIDIEQISGTPISFEVHYGDRTILVKLDT